MQIIEKRFREVKAGDIAAAVGLKYTRTGDTLCAEEDPVVMEKIIFPEPVIQIAIEPKTKADQDKLSDALSKLSDEDPTFKVKVDEETGQTLISGMGELHLEILVDRMKREFKVEANVGKPQVAYRETITQSVQAEGKFIKQSGGRGKYGHVWIELSQMNLEKDMNLLMQLLVELFQKNIYLQFLRNSRSNEKWCNCRISSG